MSQHIERKRFEQVNETKNSDHLVREIAFIEKVNTTVADLCKIEHIPLGEKYIRGGSWIKRHLRLYRMSKKFDINSTSNEDLLHNKAILDWRAYEEDHVKHVHVNWFDLAGESRKVIYKARHDVHTLFGRNPFNMRKILNDERFNIEDCLPSGETFTSVQGDLHFARRFAKKRSWTVTYDAFDDAAWVIYHTRWLKKAAKAHFPFISRCDRGALYDLYRNSKGPVGFLVFKHLLAEHVMTFVTGSRATTVAKDAFKRRFINIEPLFNVILQRIVAYYCLNQLNSLGNNIPSGQSRHKVMISNPRYATIDFSNASDSVVLAVVKFLFPPHFFKVLERYRSPYVRLLDGEYYKPSKLSSMGNGFTFEIMTLMLLLIGRQLCDETSVYGDDVIINNTAAVRFIDVCRGIGFKINETKTFVNSRFRESCGAFYHDGEGYLESYDFTPAENLLDAVILVNKLGVIAESDFRLRNAHWALLEAANPALLGIKPFDTTHVTHDVVVSHLTDGGLHVRTSVEFGPTSAVSLSGWIWTSYWYARYRKLKTPHCRERHARHRKLITVTASNLHYNPREFLHVTHLSMKPSIVTKAPIDRVKSSFWIGSYFAGSVCDASVRGELVVRRKTVLQTPGGLWIAT